LFNGGDAAEDRVIDHFTYAIVSDGDLMEGVASEAASFAGHQRLGKLIFLYDNNHITIDGATDLAFTESVGERFAAYGWHVQSVDDGNDLDAIEKSVQAARDENGRPSLISVRTHIGFGSPKQDSEKSHGEPLGADAMKATREKLGWPQEPAFYIPEEALSHFREATDRGRDLERAWRERLTHYRERHSNRAAQLDDAMSGRLPEGWDRDIPIFEPGERKVATRAASGKVLNGLAKRLPTLIGGSADLAGSNQTYLTDAPVFASNARQGRNFHFGVREHGMGAIVNGMALHGGIHPYGATFLIFSDYTRPSIRLAALMEVPSIFVFTHDSVGLGEDGPTHQPVEHLMSLRAIPNLTVIRPADANETAAAWRVALEHDGPVALALTRQGLTVLDAGRYPIAEGVPRGAYILSDAPSGDARLVIIASGSEVGMAIEAQNTLAEKGIGARVVSMPSWELFDLQAQSYRREVLPPALPKIAIEAGSRRGWRDYVGENGVIIGIDRFGASAPGAVALEKLGISADHVVSQALTYFEK
jgi:transketolase